MEGGRRKIFKEESEYTREKIAELMRSIDNATADEFVKILSPLPERVRKIIINRLSRETKDKRSRELSRILDGWQYGK